MHPKLLSPPPARLLATTIAAFFASSALAMSQSQIQSLLDIMSRLRHPTEGCPWDREQNFASVAPYTIEEAYEVVDAIERADMDGLRDELGDLLLQVVFHARMAEEAGHFDFADVVQAICDKMIRRHPHVFGDARIRDAAAQTTAWELQKSAERKAGGDTDSSALAGVARGLPELLRAQKLTRRAATVGYDWPDPAPVLAKLQEEIGEFTAAAAADEGPDRLEDEFGDMLFVLVNLGRHYKIDPQAALRRANAKFERRFRGMEALAAARGIDFAALDLQAQDALWNEVKRSERAVAG